MKWYHILLGIVVVVVTAVLTYNALNIVNDFIEGDQSDKSRECASSKYNTHTNSTEAYYVFGKCYVEKHDYSYQTRNVCNGGFLGIGQSCYESDTPRTVSRSKEVCFVLETGERC